MRTATKWKLCVAQALLGCSVLAQTPVPASPQPDSAGPPPPHRGQVIIQSHGEAPSGTAVPRPPHATSPEQPVAGDDTKADISDEERGSVSFTRYDLDARLNPSRSELSMRARIAVRNESQVSLRLLPLQISSTLHWESATLLHERERFALPFAQHRLDTDADHTGAATEAVLTLPEPLAPGATLSLDLFYSGTLEQSAGRLARLGASAAQGRSNDWDGIGPAWTGLRGFGNVLWYPVAAPQLFLSDGNSLFTAVGRARLHEQSASVRLRLSVAYTGEPPIAAYFCGRRAPLVAIGDDPSVPTAVGAGIASADFPAAPLGFRLPSLFVIEQPEVLLGASGPGPGGSSSPGADTPSSSSSVPRGAPASDSGPVTNIDVAASTATSPFLALVSDDPGSASSLGVAADHAASLVSDWLGPRPLSALTVLDHSGQPFQDGPLLVAPAATLETSPEAPALVYSLTHAWLQTGQPWMDEGVAQFFALLWVEHESGRSAALAQLGELLQPVALVEPDLSSAADTKPGQPLIGASDELFYRRKAAAVWWMLRDLAGEKPLRAALAAWRTQSAASTPAADQAAGFQHLLEHLSGKDLGAFFADWVLRDRGLPDLSIADVETSQTPANAGHSAGWLVAITVRNDGGAVADVPLVVRSAQFSSTGRIRVAGFTQATQRVLVESAPTEVIVNDGSTPELRVSTHSRTLNVRPQ